MTDCRSGTTPYPGTLGLHRCKSITNFAAVTIARDNVFGDNSDAQIAAQTPAVTGSISAGYATTATVGIAG